MVFFKKKERLLPRDSTLSRRRYDKMIAYYERSKQADLEQIMEATGDLNQGIQRYPTPNMEIIRRATVSYWHQCLFQFSTFYSMGSEWRVLTEGYEGVLEAAKQLDQLDAYAYKECLATVSLAVLVGGPEDLASLKKICEDSYGGDPLLQFLLSPTDYSQAQPQSLFIEKPYDGCLQVIELAQHDQGAALVRLQRYIQQGWKIRGSYRNYSQYNNNRYAGNWCYESAALVKLLGLDDTSWRSEQYYPYDLVHGSGTAESED